mgnify:CR=1 FL=1
MSTTVEERLRRVFTATLAVEAPTPTADLIDGGLLDSLALVELLAAIETEFGIEIPLDELDLDRIRTLESLTELVGERVARTTRGAA